MGWQPPLDSKPNFFKLSNKSLVPDGSWLMARSVRVGVARGAWRGRQTLAPTPAPAVKLEAWTLSQEPLSTHQTSTNQNTN